MHTLRTSSIFARLVLACYLLMVSVAGASPLVHPQMMDIVCTADGEMKLIVINGDEQAAEFGKHTLDCSLCLAASLPAPCLQSKSDIKQPLAHALLPAVEAHIAALVGAPLPPRGPPVLA